MRTFISILCIAMVCIPRMAQADDEALRETARLGSVTYNISIRFWEDKIRELTPSERRDVIEEFFSKLKNGKLNPLETYELIRLLSIDGRSEEEEKMVGALSVRVDSILAVDSKDHEALLASVRLASRKGDNDLLFSLLADTTLQDKTYRSLLIELSNLHFGIGNYGKAEEVIDHVIAFDSLDTEAAMTKTSIRATSLIYRILTQGFVVFTEEIEKTEPQERLPKTLKWIDDEYAEIDFSLIEKAIQRDPENFEFHCFVGTVKEFIVYLHYLVLISSIEEQDSLPRFTEEKIPVLKDIRESLEKAMETKPAGDIDVFMALAMYYLVIADFPTARSFAQKAIEARPDLDQSYDALITVINFQRQAIEDDVEAGFDESIEVLKMKKKNKPLQLIDKLMQLQPFIFGEKYETAVKELGSIEKDHPNEPTVLLFKGGVLLRMGKADDAIKVLSEAKMIDSKNKDILYNLGLGYVLKEEYGQAKVYLEAAFENDPSDEEIKELLEQVNEEFK